jgi:hypothetical protein
LNKGSIERRSKIVSFPPILPGIVMSSITASKGNPFPLQVQGSIFPSDPLTQKSSSDVASSSSIDAVNSSLVAFSSSPELKKDKNIFKIRKQAALIYRLSEINKSIFCYYIVFLYV